MVVLALVCATSETGLAMPPTDYTPAIVSALITALVSGIGAWLGYKGKQAELKAAANGAANDKDAELRKMIVESGDRVNQLLYQQIQDLRAALAERDKEDSASRERERALMRENAEAAAKNILLEGRLLQTSKERDHYKKIIDEELQPLRAEVAALRQKVASLAGRTT